ncbi:TonB-dependent receptor [Rhodanobacter sp. 7MK24]|uniref:TonB-dependent receptor n=1 Tax=Rhodanobacter sp. 7MK24 TaxID=2775922 RepID=UPI00177AAB05|nr:TonB-dependent receptor [Rhodanobacter sp. 7MK24]MBD8879905.1 TonB-dependent receptor [Rhodanobacter sp. 7MK24]
MTMRLRPLSVQLRLALLGSTMMLAAPLAAWAADAPQNTDAGQTANAPAATPSPGTAKNNQSTTELGKITVTAQSRTQEMQQVPIALQIVTAKDIASVTATDISQMQYFVPGLVVTTSQPTQPGYTLRGITTEDFGIGTEPAVGVYVDGVYADRTGGSMLAFNDIQRIEVLKGPQGTLFGRNAAGGAISIVTNEPSDKFEGDATLRYGNYGERYAYGLVNIPLNKDMALRVSAYDNQSDGWIKDQATGQRYGDNGDWGTRAVFRWNITPDTRMLLSWDHEKLNQAPQAAIGLVPLSDFTLRQPSGLVLPPFPAEPSTYLNPLNAPLYNDAVGADERRRFDGVTLTLDHNFAWGSLTSTTAWRNFDTFNLEDSDGTANIDTYLATANIEHNNAFSQEFKLASSNDLLDWVTGVSWYSEQARQGNQVDVTTDSIDTLAVNTGAQTGTPTGTLFHYFQSMLDAYNLPYNLLGDPWTEQINNNGNYKSYAAFGDVIWHLSDKLDLTTGARFTHDERDFSWFNIPRQAPQLDNTLSQLQQAGILDMAAAMAGIPTSALLSAFQSNEIFTASGGAPVNTLVSAHNTWNDFSPRAVLSYKFTQDVMAYFSVAKGYKAGGYESLDIGSHFAPEKVWNYEAGIKTVLPEYNLLFNGSVYYYRYYNLQEQVLNPNVTGQPGSNGTGIPYYTTSVSNEEAKGVDLEAQWQPVEPLKFNANVAYISQRYLQSTAPDGTVLNGQPTGNPLWSATAGMAYTVHNVANGNVVFNFQYGFRSKTRCNGESEIQGTCQTSPNFQVGMAQRHANARLDWQTPDQRWDVGLFVNNVFNERYIGITNLTTTVFGTPWAVIDPPRTYGAELRVKF